MYLGVVVLKFFIIEKKICVKNDIVYILLCICKLYFILLIIRIVIVDCYFINFIFNKWINYILIIFY